MLKRTQTQCVSMSISLTELFIKILYSLNITHSDQSLILARSAVQSNIMSWQLQELSMRALNKSTIWLSKLFQIFTILFENEYFLMSSQKLTLINFYLLPLVEGGNLYWYRWIIITYYTYYFKNFYHISSNPSIFHRKRLYIYQYLILITMYHSSLIIY